MLLQKEDFPVTIQAFDITDNKEYFIAEQLVNSQSDVDTFSARYAGKVIKVKASSAATGTTTTTHQHTAKKSNSALWIILVLIIIILIAVGFYTGWIQRNTGISV